MTDDINTNEPMGEITSDDKLWSLLTYILTPIVPIIIYLMEDKKNRPFIKSHNAQALLIGVVQVILSFFAWTCVTPILQLLIFVAQIYWGIKAYQGETVNIPFVTDFVKNQGWA